MSFFSGAWDRFSSFAAASWASALNASRVAAAQAEVYL